ncbi:MAG TPA: hypothetical protein VJ623_03480 [Holophagaceae bacterium]|nr:hypothetical protein [Holophagaceae bacterium]
MTTIFVRINRVGWVHLWPSREAFDEGEPSVHFFNGRIDPRWQEAWPKLPAEVRAALERGEVTATEDPGYLDEG